MRVAIIGAGIVGIQCAHALLDDGYQVTMLDPDGLAERTSRGNAGMIAFTDIEPVASPKMWRRLPGWLIDPVGPLTLRPSYLPRALPWMLRFLAASRPAAVERSRQGLIAIHGLARPAWERRVTALGIGDRHFRRRGHLFCFTRPGDAAGLAPTIARQRAAGIEVEVLDGPAARRLEPAFGPAIHGAAYYPGGIGVDDPKHLADALGRSALDRGATLERVAVNRITPIQGGVRLGHAAGELTAEMVVIAAGVWSKPLAAQLGDTIPLESERGYNVSLPKGALGLTRTVILEGQGVALSPMDGFDRLGGAVEFAGLTAAPNYARVDAMITRTQRYLPDAKLTGGTRWMGHRPSLPDSLPVLSRATATDRVVYAFGSGHYGLTQSAAMGEVVAALVGQRTSPIDLSHFAADRFR